MSSKEKAQRYTRLAADDVFRELLEDVRNDAIGVFLSQSRSDEAISRARNLIDALNTIEIKINAAQVDDLVDDKKRKSGPWTRLTM